MFRRFGIISISILFLLFKIVNMFLFDLIRSVNDGRVILRGNS